MFKKFKKGHPNIHAFFVGLSIIAFWRGAWMLMDKYVFPENAFLSAIVPAVLGILFLFFNDFKLKELDI
jgi:hypothetical protein